MIYRSYTGASNYFLDIITSTTMNFADIPFEILLKIAFLLGDWKDMYVFTVLCRRFLELRRYRPLAVYARRLFEVN